VSHVVVESVREKVKFLDLNSFLVHLLVLDLFVKGLK
jgi:hypothetical protein